MARMKRHAEKLADVEVERIKDSLTDDVDAGGVFANKNPVIVDRLLMLHRIPVDINRLKEEKK